MLMPGGEPPAQFKREQRLDGSGGGEEANQLIRGRGGRLRDEGLALVDSGGGGFGAVVVVVAEGFEVLRSGFEGKGVGERVV